jgi:hypothetical protein
VDDLTDLLTRALAAVPPGHPAAADAREALAYGEYDVALGLMTEPADGWRPPPDWWDLLVGAADLMRLRPVAAWCRWGRWESVHGVLRASLDLTVGGPIPGRGIARVRWDIGLDDPRVARIWVEYAPSLAPASTGSIRLAPLTPADWRSLRPGRQITIDEHPHLAGTATILEMVP